MMDFTNIPVMPQRQDSVNEQMTDLQFVANKLGMYDASDAIRQLMPKLPKIKCGCYIEIGEEPMSDCVLENGEGASECIEAENGEEGMRKEQCKYWRIIT